MAKKQSNSRKSGSGTRIRGRSYLGTPSTPSPSGAFVVNNYEIDTNLVTTLTTMKTLFQRWRIHKLVFHYVPARAITLDGVIYMCVVTDPASSAPYDAVSFMGQQVMHVSHIRKAAKLTYIPKHEGWLYTDDLVTYDDRWEMPGEFYIASAHGLSTTSAPGVLYIDFDISFDLFTNSATSLTKMIEDKADAKAEVLAEEKLKKRLASIGVRQD